MFAASRFAHDQHVRLALKRDPAGPFPGSPRRARLSACISPSTAMSGGAGRSAPPLRASSAHPASRPSRSRNATAARSWAPARSGAHARPPGSPCRRFSRALGSSAHECRRGNRRLRGDHQRQRRKILGAGRQTNDVLDVAQPRGEPPLDAAEHCIHVTALQRDGGDDRRVRTHQRPAPHRGGCPCGRRPRCRSGHSRGVARIILRIDQSKSLPGRIDRPNRSSRLSTTLGGRSGSGRRAPPPPRSAPRAARARPRASALDDPLRISLRRLQDRLHDEARPGRRSATAAPHRPGNPRSASARRRSPWRRAPRPARS